MNSGSDRWRPLPDFSVRYKALLRAYGLNPKALSERLKTIGIDCSRAHAYRLQEVPADQVTAVSAQILAGILRVCPAVDAGYFFDEDVSEQSEMLTLMYVERGAPINRKPGPKPTS